MSITKVVIPAAGLGTRLFPATKSQPKEMLPLGRKPMIQLVVEEMLQAGLWKVLVITGQKKRAIEDHFDSTDGEIFTPEASDPDRLLPQFFFRRQAAQRGLGDAVRHAREFTGDQPFAVALGDCVIDGNGPAPLMRRLLDAHSSTGAVATIAVQQVPPEAVSSYGVVAPDGEPGPAFPIRDIVEKPTPESAPSNLAVAARYAFGPEVYDFLERTKPGHGGEIQLTDAIRLMLHEGLPVHCVALTPGERRLDIGSFKLYAEAFFSMMLRDPELGDGLGDYVRGLLDDTQ
ncbi:MAG: UTP--glucose-1-phosphate uridylyltransferase [Armatimonadota bacterium]